MSPEMGEMVPQPFLFTSVSVSKSSKNVDPAEARVAPWGSFLVWWKDAGLSADTPASCGLEPVPLLPWASAYTSLTWVALKAGV